jgi:hypothetical protein
MLNYYVINRKPVRLESFVILKVRSQEQIICLRMRMFSIKKRRNDNYVNLNMRKFQSETFTHGESPKFTADAAPLRNSNNQRSPFKLLCPENKHQE